MRAEELVEFIAANGELPPKGTPEMNWLLAQRRAFRAGNLAVDRVLYLESAIPGWRRDLRAFARSTVDEQGEYQSSHVDESFEDTPVRIARPAASDPTWAAKVVRTAAYVHSAAQLPPTDHPLHAWLQRQRDDVIHNPTNWTAERVLYLDIAAPGWRADVDDTVVASIFTSPEVVESPLPERAGHDRPIAPPHIDEGVSLSPKGLDVAEPTFDVSWHGHANDLVVYVREHDSFPVPGSNLGEWLAQQRNSARTEAANWTNVQQSYLDTLVPGWQDEVSPKTADSAGGGPRPDNDAKWREKADQLAAYVREYRVLPYPGHVLYGWLHTQRSAALGRQGAWNPERQMYLDAAVPHWRDDRYWRRGRP